MAQRSLLSRLWYRVLRRVCQLTAVLVFGLRHWGRENIPAEGGVLVVANHQSNLDPPLVGMGCFRRMNYVARLTLFGFAPFRWLINSLDAIPIDQEGIGLSGMKESLRRLKRGEMVLIFPEGSRTLDGRIAPFMPGFTALAVRSKASILPVAIEGAFDAWPRTRRFPRPATIHVRYAPPILPGEIERLDERELLAEVERRVRRCHEQLRGHPLFAPGRQSPGQIEGQQRHFGT